MFRLSTLALCVGLVTTLTAPAVLAQTKPAAAAESAKGLGGGRATGKLLTLAELRVCIQRQDDLAQRKATIDAQRTAMNQERDRITAETAALAQEGEKLKALSNSLTDINHRFTALNARVAAFQERQQDFANAGRSGPLADRTRRELDAEQRAIAKEEATLKADAKQLDETVNRAKTEYTTRADTLERQVADWNARNKTQDGLASQHEDDRISWLETCGNRRYKEDDEKLIRAGK